MHKSPLNPGPWFNPHSLEALAEAGAWARGLMLYRGQKVVDMQIEPQGDGWLLQGEVQGSQRQPYLLTIDMALTPDGAVDYWDSRCSCPVARQCKHGVALMIKAAYQGLQFMALHGSPLQARTPPTPEQLEASRQAAQARAEDIARQEAETQLLRWCEALDQAGNAPAPAAGGTHKLARPPQYLYLLGVMGSQGLKPQLKLDTVVASAKASSGWNKGKILRSAPAPGLAVYDQASDADRNVLQLLRALPDSSGRYWSYSYSASVLLDGQAGLLALEQAASTGRLFLEGSKGYAGAALQWGPPQMLD
ncbi:MAG: helicase SNF2, partial [Polaromonas sp.]|nr:helicase SNF2 [Polaromonas sp.]